MREIGTIENYSSDMKDKDHDAAIETNKVWDKQKLSDHVEAGRENKYMRQVAAAVAKNEKADRAEGNMELRAEKEDAQRSATAAAEEEAAARKEAAQELESFTNSVKKAKTVLKGLSEVASFGLGGNKSAMDEIRFAAASGEDVNRVRGTRIALEKAGMSTEGINATLRASGTQQNLFNNEMTAAAEVARQHTVRGASNLPGVRELDLATMAEQKAMSPIDKVAYVKDLMEGQTPEAQQYIGMYNMVDLVSARTDGDTISAAMYDLDVDGAYATREGVVKAENLLRIGAEEVGTAGELAGKGMVAAREADKLADSAFGGMLGKGVAAALGLGGAGIAAKKLRAASTGKVKGPVPNGRGPMATKVNPATLRGAATATSVARLATTGVASVVPALLRYGLEIEDDGGAGDSAMDILDWTTGGAVLGTMVGGPVGTIPGAAVGAGVGVINEAIEYFMPSDEIGPVANPKPSGAGSTQVNNVEVDVRIDPAGYKVETNVNGDETLDR